MSNLLIRDLPEDLHRWLRQDAQANHRSANRHAIALLDSVRQRTGDSSARPTTAERDEAYAVLRVKLAELHKQMAALPTINTHLTDDEIIGYDEHGAPQ